MPSVTFSIPSHADAIRWACLAVRGVLEGIKMGDDDKFYVELAVSEAATNSLRHAYGGNPDNEIELRLILDAERLMVEISDNGSPLDPARVENATLPPDDMPQVDHGGRGLFLIRQAMDDVQIKRVDGRNVFIMTKGHDGLK